MEKVKGMYIVGYNNYGQLFTKDQVSKRLHNKSRNRQRHNNSINNKNYDNPTGAIADQDGMVYTVGYKWSWANGK